MTQGIFAALLTPFSADGKRLELEKLKPYIEYLVESGVHGIFICGTTGEGLLLTAEEKMALMDAAFEAAGGQLQVIVQATCADINGTVRVARRAAELNADGISVIQPWLYPCDGDAQFRYIASVVAETGDAPVYLYNIPGFTGNPLTPETLDRLLDAFPSICGIKESGTMENLKEWLKRKSERFQVFCGMDDVNEQAFKLGAVGLVSSTCNVQPKVFHAFYTCVQDGDWECAKIQQEQMVRFIDLLGDNWIAVIKESLRCKGIDTGSVRQPLRDLKADEREALKAGLKAIGVIE